MRRVFNKVTTKGWSGGGFQASLASDAKEMRGGAGVSGGRGAERVGQAEVRGRRLKIEFSARISTKIEQPR